MLPPPGTSPHVLANAIKAFLITMPEPLLTFRSVPSQDWVAPPAWGTLQATSHHSGQLNSPRMAALLPDVWLAHEAHLLQMVPELCSLKYDLSCPLKPT